MLSTTIGLIVIGLVAGSIGHAVAPKRQSMTIPQTMVLGIVGAFVGGILGFMLFGRGDSLVQPASWIGSIIGSMIALLIYLLTQRRSRTGPSSVA